MVSNPRKKAGSGRIRPLNQPVPVEVDKDEHEMPSTIVVRNQKNRVISIQDIWEIVDEWWQPNPISRRYYQVIIEGNKNITVFYDLINGIWYKQQT